MKKTYSNNINKLLTPNQTNQENLQQQHQKVMKKTWSNNINKLLTSNQTNQENLQQQHQ